MAFEDLTRQVFERLTVVKFDHFYEVPNAKRNGKRRDMLRPVWQCLCTCGTYVFVDSSSLKSHNTRSCGCLRVDMMRAKGLGHKNHPNYVVWQNMRQRCHNVNHPQYNDYGGRGITIDPRWDTFENFIIDMGTRPSKKHLIERKDNHGPYSLWNCIWATSLEQNKNKRSNLLLTAFGVTLHLAEWLRRTKISERSYYRWLDHGLSFDEILDKFHITAI
jgi:hypothetical protein